MKKHIFSSLLWIFSLILTACAIRYLPDMVSVSANATGMELPVTSVERSDSRLSLTFSAAGNCLELSNLLEILDSRQVKATFFLTGTWTDRYPNETAQIAKAGHQLGVLGDHYQDFTSLNRQEILLELRTTSDKIQELTGIRPKLFRPPYGTYNNEVIRSASDCGLTTVTWNVDSLDWKDQGEDAVIDTILNHPQFGSGAILYFHVGAKYTPKALDSLLTILEKKNYQAVPLSQLLYEKNYTLDTEGRQFPL